MSITRTVVALEYHFLRGPDGDHFAHKHYGYDFWSRYLAVFDEVIVLARARVVAEIPAGWRRVEGERVRFAEVPDYVGAVGFTRVFGKASQAARQALGTADCAVLRTPGLVGWLLEREARKQRKPFAVEVVGDPEEVFSTGGAGGRLAPIVCRWFVHRLRTQCRDAVAASYVTARTLQRKYPSGSHAFATSYSSVELPESAIASESRPFDAADEGPWRLVFVGSLEGRHKGLDVLLAALAKLDSVAGRKLELRVLGEGHLRAELERSCAELGIAERVSFAGQIPSGPPVWAELRTADLFVLPSRAEGLPRALIEAKAAGLPCIATPVAGIPELVEAEDLVPIDDPEALASKVREVLGDPERLRRMSAAGIVQARDFRSDVLARRRTECYAALRAAATTTASASAHHPHSSTGVARES